MLFCSPANGTVKADFVLIMGNLRGRPYSCCGLQGLPNAGKSSLLAAVTVAKPEIAAYPFTTLMPNLGCLEGDPMKNDGGFSSGATMADLPGLIKDAHLGKVIYVLVIFMWFS